MSNDVLGSSVFDEEKGGEIDYVSLIDRTRWPDTGIELDAAYEEAAQVLAEIRTLLLESKLHTRPEFGSCLGEGLLEQLVAQYTVQVAPKVFAQVDLVSALRGKSLDGDWEQIENRGNLLAASVLEDAVPVLNALRPDPRAEDLIARITKKSRISRGAPMDEAHHLHCDGFRYEHPCWATSPRAFSQEEAGIRARGAGWLVSEEKDLCSRCWMKEDPEAAEAAGSLPTSGDPFTPGFMPVVPLGDLDLDRELTLAEAAAGPGPTPPPELTEEMSVMQLIALLSGAVASGVKTDEIMAQLEEQFGAHVVRALADEFPSEERVLEIAQKNATDITAMLPVFEAIRALKSVEPSA